MTQIRGQLGRADSEGRGETILPTFSVYAMALMRARRSVRRDLRTP